MPIPLLVWAVVSAGGVGGIRNFFSDGDEEFDDEGFCLPAELLKADRQVRCRYQELWEAQDGAAWRRGVAAPFAALSPAAVARYGLPAGARVAAWLELSGAAERMREAADAGGAYGSLPESPEHARAVANDVPRTFPRCRAFEEDGGAGQLALGRLLRRLAARCRDGYCQSMNFIAAFLLLVAAGTPPRAPPEAAGAEEPAATPEWPGRGEEEAFWLLDAVVHGEQYSKDYYTDSSRGRDQGLRQCVADLRVVEALLRVRLPRLSAHLHAQLLSPATVCLPWLLCAFIDCVAWPHALVIFDLFVLQGTPFIVSLTLLIFTRYESALLDCEMDSIASVARERLRREEDLPSLLSDAAAGDARVTAEVLRELRRLDDVWLLLAQQQQGEEEGLRGSERDERKRITDAAVASLAAIVSRG